MINERFGRLKNKDMVDIVTLANEFAELKPFGVSIIGGYDCVEDYEADTGSYQGATIGRVANRIKNAQFTMDGAIYMVTSNDGDNCLHGGSGFNSKLWKIDDVCDDSVTMSYESFDGEDGFPSGLEVKVKFTLKDASVIIEYEAIPDGKTPIALTNHSYFNLDGFGSVINNHTLTLYADRYTDVDSTLIPNGVRPFVEGTPFDFRSPKKIGDDFGRVDGYDHNFILCPKTSAVFAEKSVPLCATVTNGKLTMNVYTDQPGIQFYTGNFLGGKPDFRNETPKIKHGAFCLEAQTEPNCINHGIGFYEAGEVYKQITVYEVKKS